MMLVSVALGARPDTVNGLSGIGDLMLTCFGKVRVRVRVCVRVLACVGVRACVCVYVW